MLRGGGSSSSDGSGSDGVNVVDVDDEGAAMQQRLNFAHTFFETMMGSAEQPAQFWLQGSRALRSAIERYADPFPRCNSATL